MPVKIPAAKYEHASHRLDCKNFPHQKRPHWLRLDRGIALGYRTSEPNGPNAPRGAGTWVKQIHHKETRIATADDYEAANGVEVMTLAQARAAILGDVRTDVIAASRCTIETMLSVIYPDHLKDQGKRASNAVTILHHIENLAPDYLRRDVNVMSKDEWLNLSKLLRSKGMSAPTWNRLRKCLRAALNLVAPGRKEIWDKPLGKVSDRRKAAEKHNNVVIEEHEVLRWIAASYEDSYGFGLLVDVLATTGTRPDQATRLRVEHLHAEDNRLDMPKSGKCPDDPLARKEDTYRVYIPASLTARLVAAAKGRKGSECLLLRDNGEPWGGANGRPYMKYYPHVQRSLKACDLMTNKDGEEVSLYSLRHTNITRQLMGKKDPKDARRYLVPPLPAIIVAKAHDTSVVMIEGHYGAKIADHAEDAIRATLLDHGTVVELTERGAA